MGGVPSIHEEFLRRRQEEYSIKPAATSAEQRLPNRVGSISSNDAFFDRQGFWFPLCGCSSKLPVCQCRADGSHKARQGQPWPELASDPTSTARLTGRRLLFCSCSRPQSQPWSSFDSTDAAVAAVTGDAGWSAAAFVVGMANSTVMGAMDRGLIKQSFMDQFEGYWPSYWLSLIRTVVSIDVSSLSAWN